MKNYYVTIEETVSKSFVVCADNFSDAEQIVRKKYKDAEIVLEPGNIESTVFRLTDASYNESTEWIEV